MATSEMDIKLEIKLELDDMDISPIKLQPPDVAFPSTQSLLEIKEKRPKKLTDKAKVLAQTKVKNVKKSTKKTVEKETAKKTVVKEAAKKTVEKQTAKKTAEKVQKKPPPAKKAKILAYEDEPMYSGELASASTSKKDRKEDFKDLMDPGDTGSVTDFSPILLEDIIPDEGMSYKSYIHVPRGVWENAEERTDDAHDEEVLKIALKDDEAEEKILLNIGKNFEWSTDFTKFSGTKEAFKNSDSAGPQSTFNSPYEAFCAIWDRRIMQTIARETNFYARVKILQSKQPDRQWKDTDVNELYILFGIFVFLGWKQSNNLMMDPNNQDIMHMTYLAKVMPYDRFEVLISCLHFINNKSLSNLKDEELQLAKLQPIARHCSEKFESLFKPYCKISINDSIPLMAGQYMYDYFDAKGKGKGKRLYELSDATTGYVWRVLPHTGRLCTPDSTPQETGVGDHGLGASVVLKLTEGIRDIGHTLIIDKCLSSPLLARYLKHQGTDVTGLVRACRSHIPQDIKDLVDEDLRAGYRLSRHCGDLSVNSFVETITSRYFCDSQKVNNVLSTFLDDSSYSETSMQPAALAFYHSSLQVIDKRDNKLENIEIANDINVKWYMLAFTRILQVSVWNAYVLLNTELTNNKRPSFMMFKEQLCKNLMDIHIKDTVFESIQNDLRFSRGPHYPYPIKEINPQNAQTSYNRCIRCKALDVPKESQYGCSQCNVPLCIGKCFEEYHSIKDLH